MYNKYLDQLKADFKVDFSAEDVICKFIYYFLYLLKTKKKIFN